MAKRRIMDRTEQIDFAQYLLDVFVGHNVRLRKTTFVLGMEDARAYYSDATLEMRVYILDHQTSGYLRVWQTLKLASSRAILRHHWLVKIILAWRVKAAVNRVVNTLLEMDKVRAATPPGMVSRQLEEMLSWIGDWDER